MTPEGLRELLPSICDRETAYNPESWSRDNPLGGHCTVVSLLVQDLWGGELLRASLRGTEFAGMRWHYWNRLPDGREIDLTGSQFNDNYPKDLKPVVRLRSRVMSFPEVKRRYAALLQRLARRRDIRLPKFFKVLRQDLTSVGLLGADRLQYKLRKWVKPREPLSDHCRKGGGLWVVKKAGDARHIRKYLREKHGITARIFECRIGRILFESSFRVKTDRVLLLKEIH